MNKSNGVNGLLTNASLFRNNQKNRFVSAYLTHQTYFGRDEPPAHSVHAPNNTKSKKDYPFIQQLHSQVVQSRENRNDALQATVKREMGEDLPSRIGEGGDRRIGQSKIQQQNQILAMQAKSIRRKQEANPTSNAPESFERSLHQSIVQPIDHPNTKIIVNYSKTPGQIEKSMKIQPSESYHVEEVRSSKNPRQSYLNIKDEELESNYHHGQKHNPHLVQKNNNPYLPSSLKKQNEELNVYHTANGDVALKKIESNSFQPLSVPPETPRQPLFLTSSSIVQKKNSQGDSQTNYLQNIKRDISGYLLNVKEKLNGSYICLQTIEYQFDVLVDKTIQLECEKLKNRLYKMIDQEINDFKQYQRRQFSKNKFYFMSDLFEIKCNIDLRLEEIEQHELQLKDEYRWKNNVQSILGIDYNQNINFILKKADEIQKDLLANISTNLNEEVRGVSEEITRTMKKTIRNSFQGICQSLNATKAKRKTPPPQPPSNQT